MTGSGPTRPIGKRSGDVPRDVDQDTRRSELVGLLRDLIQQLGPVDAAAELGIAYTTLRRSLDAGALTHRVELALERYSMLRHGADVPDSPFVARMTALEERMGRVEDRVNVQGDLVAKIGTDVTSLQSELSSRVKRFDQAVDRLTADIKELAGRIEAASSKVARTTSAVANSSVVAGSSSSAHATTGAPLASIKEQQRQAAWKEWEFIKAQERDARTKLERAIARIRRIELELELINEFKHNETIPSGKLWSPLNRSFEREVRWDLLAEAQRDRRRYERRRCIRRVLTLGLWRR